MYAKTSTIHQCVCVTDLVTTKRCHKPEKKNKVSIYETIVFSEETALV